MGKLATHEFAHGGPSFDLPWPPARNPWNTAHFTGGSSSGSGAAIAAGLVPASLGSDTGGSIRGPAGLCGIAGLKPTYGLVSRAGVLPNSYSYDHCGPMARTARIARCILNAIAGHDPADPASSLAARRGFRHRPRCWASRDCASASSATSGKRISACHAELAAALEQPRSACCASWARSVEDVTLRPLQILLRRQDRDGRERTVLAAPARADRQTRCSSGRTSGRAASPPACSRPRTTCAQAASGAPCSAEMRPLYRRFDLFLTANASAAPRLDQHDPLSFWTAAESHLAVQLHRRPGAGPAVRLHEGRLAAVAADRRPAVRRCARAARRPCLRAGDRLLQARAGR